MKLALSTNWCNRRLESGRDIAEKAVELGFDELELGFHTTAEQAKEIAAMRDVIPVGSIHAFCPVPLSAPQGYPELYQLADFDDETRALARVHVKKNIEFAAYVGADAVVLHAGRVSCSGPLERLDLWRRQRRGRRLIDVFRRELDLVVPVLEKHRVILALENLPYLEGFPAEWEIGELVGEWVRPWLDTGHDHVRRQRGWTADDLAIWREHQPVGLHLSDSRGHDDHLPPGKGKVDFAALGEIAAKARHLVFEPNADTAEAQLRRGVRNIRRLWKI